MKHPNLFEVKRKLLHILVGIIGIFLIQFDILNSKIIFALLIFGILLSISCMKFKIPIADYFLNTFERTEEKKHLPDEL